MAKLEACLLLLFLLTSSQILIHGIVYGAGDIIRTNQIIRDGDTIVSSDGTFELGFFSPGNSSRNKYVGIWYKNVPVQTVVWVANREIPLTNTTAVVLKVVDPGLLVLINETNGVVWSTNTSRSVKNPVAQLLESGNLVVRDGNEDNSPGNILWQSFDYPTDTYLPEMKFGWNLATGLEVYFSSWKSPDDPARGEFTDHVDPTGYPQIILKRGSVVIHRSGPWNGLTFSGLAYARNNPTYQLRLVMNKNEVSVSRYAIDRSVISKTSVSPGGVAQRWTWVDRTRSWVLVYNLPADNCDTYKLCGAHGICNVGNFVSCECMEKFVPKDEQGWGKGDWTDGCVRRTNLSCNGDGFFKYSGIKLPDARYSRFNETMTLEECRTECSRNCSCSAYTHLDISKGGSGCLLYFGELVDIRVLNQDGQDLYIRMASSELVLDSKQKKRVKILASVAASVVGVVLLGVILTVYVQKRKKHTEMTRKESYGVSHAKDSELPLFKLSTILKATDDFSICNKLGEGGFGPVYKGVLEDGHKIAVKRLSDNSMQGVEEFKNEIVLIAKLQHRNLVRLLGCCIEGDESMLIYEYMPHKSLDMALFDPTKSGLLDWSTRFIIMNGIARGLMYLHQDSRLRIIHRDLKTSNILLDSDMNPKISDFGLARSFGGNDSQSTTRKVVGTYGYMSPEYAAHGLFSEKSDVFSFGVILLEIISGKRNRGYSDDEDNLNLLGYAWTLYREDRPCDLVDASLGDSFDLPEAIRSIHVGLLCVQGCPEDRPGMSSVVFMLGNEVTLPEAKHPGFFMESYAFLGQRFTERNSRTGISVNEVTITMPNGR